MKQKFIVWIRYRTTDENGKNKVVNEPFLVSAVNFTDAEIVMTETAKQFTDDFRVKRMSTSKICDVFQSLLLSDIIKSTDMEHESIYFEIKVEHIALDADSMKEQKIKETVLVESPSITDAIQTAIVELKNCSNLRVIQAKETKIVEHIK